MTRDEWDRFERVQNEPNVLHAMRARCEEQGHEYWINYCSAMFHIYMECKWCGDRR